ATNLKIEGGGLKSFIKTRWTSMYEATSSIIRMQHALEEIAFNKSDEITNKIVKRYLKKRIFYDEVTTLSKILQPIKTAILMVEGEQTNLADAFIQIIR
ncbi:1655_t:CDS:2, partial [Ambispora gerdemannii]